MKKSILREVAGFVVLCGLATGMLAGCFGEDTPRPGPSGQITPTAVVTAAPTTVTVEQPVGSDAPVPVLSLSANNSRDAELVQGWPLMLEVSLTHPEFMRSDITVKPLTLGADFIPWTTAVTVDVVAADGTTQTWPLTLAGAPEGAVTLDAEQYSTAFWTLGTEETAKLKEGIYRVSAVLDTTAMVNGGMGKIESVASTVAVRKAPAMLSMPEKSLLARSTAAQAVVRGDNAEAMRVLDALLAEQPDDSSALEFKGDLLADEGKIQEAFQTYGEALEAFDKQNPDALEPPSILGQKQHELMDKLLETP